MNFSWRRQSVLAPGGTVLVTMLTAASANAADAPIPYGAPPPQYGPAPYAPPLPPPLPPLLPCLWLGPYVGANAGYGWGAAIGGDPSGFLGGFQAGYNFQVSPRAVFGFETDISFTSIDDPAGAAKFGVDYLGTLRARVGYSVDRVMFYVTGGAAYGQGQLEVGGLSNKQFHWGWTLGAGVEAAVTQNVSAKLEYLYVDLSDQTYQSIFGPRSIGYNTSLVRGGVTYRF